MIQSADDEKPKPPPVNLEEHLDDIEFVAWRGLKIDVWHLYETLTALGWKVDTEESNLMVAMGRTWRKEGIKVWIHLEKFVCAPPHDEVERFAQICFYRFDPASMPATTMYEKTYDPGDEKQDWFPSHREEWGWLIDHGDPQTDTFDLLTPIAFREVPKSILQDAWSEIEKGVLLIE